MVISVCKPEGLTSAERKGSYFLCGKVIKGKGGERERERGTAKKEREREANAMFCPSI